MALPRVSSPPTSSELAPSADQTRWFTDELQPHEPALRAYLHRKFPTLADVDDFVQESFLKAYLAHRDGRLTSVKGFLFHVARNSVVSFFRKQKFISPIAVNELGPLRVLENDADVVESVCSQDELELITAAMVDLPDRCREIVMLRVLRGLDSGEVARCLGLAEATVRVQLARGMKRCSEFLRHRGVIAKEQS